MDRESWDTQFREATNAWLALLSAQFGIDFELQAQNRRDVRYRIGIAGSPAVLDESYRSPGVVGDQIKLLSNIGRIAAGSRYRNREAFELELANQRRRLGVTA